ncbi:DEKNAAC103599 [Brettanomyces naardenensis]|uniref:DEKNAAC103599 n=1 Tax=Brettanomyces naardenensis TaxID=13370 RepID=A0A448YNK9_BRENA|nr:DEKNAAC103599 [Brettanomyces naardenensis]
MQFSIVLAALATAVSADVASQIGDGQVQVPASSAPAGETTVSVEETLTTTYCPETATTANNATVAPFEGAGNTAFVGAGLAGAAALALLL